MKNGLLISFEGGEGSGKTVQVKLLADEFRKQGRKVVITREPGGTPISEQIREVVLGMKNIGMAFTTEVLLFQAARAQIYRELIIPSLEAGKVVICDRTRDSSVVYQSFVRGFQRNVIDKLNDIATENTYPDATILLDVPVEIGLARRRAGELNRFDIEQVAFHEKVRKGYMNLAKTNDHNRWIIIDGTGDIDSVHEAVKQTLQQKKLLR